MPIEDAGINSQIEIGSNVDAKGKVMGKNNRVTIGNSAHPSTFNIFINGENNSIFIANPYFIKGLNIYIGNHVPAHNVEFFMGENCSTEPNGRFYLYNSGNVCRIGRDCMLSNSVTIRCGESPHLIFDKETGEYLDVSDGVYIGNHVWIGEQVYITKRAMIADESVVAACSVVTKKFTEKNAVLAGNPAKIVRTSVQ